MFLNRFWESHLSSKTIYLLQISLSTHRLLASCAGRRRTCQYSRDCIDHQDLWQHNHITTRYTRQTDNMMLAEQLQCQTKALQRNFSVVTKPTIKYHRIQRTTYWLNFESFKRKSGDNKGVIRYHPVLQQSTRFDLTFFLAFARWPRTDIMSKIRPLSRRR